eukprot:TRINITY_DN860_c0_g1_i2.p1 TRINITY_DN860_c0_g1~~TRINITY_DN860_c0_g1_i2.p1  ORF type:complete len:195 (+),score=71.35 TRINITY_DN860_c0_g1_i2:23-586(+)
MFRFCLFACLWTIAAPLSLGAESFKAEVFDSGKNAFVKFFAPWCGHCKSMAPAWETLMTEFKDSKSVAVAEVDCTVEDQLCKDEGVSGYPTIKYWEGGEKKDYNGGRSVDELRSFVLETLDKTRCQIDTLADCSSKEVKFIAKAKAMSAEEREAKEAALLKLRGNKYTKDPKFVSQRLAILKQLREA